MMRVCLASALTSGVIAAPPPHGESASVARWMVNKIDWGVMSTISTRSEASQVGDAFGNPQSHADANNGVPYFFVSGLDASIIDVFSGPGNSSRISLAISEAQLTGDEAVAACTIGDSAGDPENPPCARLVLSGNLLQLDSQSEESKMAKKALIKRHPSFRFFPPGHDFFVAKLDLDGIWLLDFYGGAANIAVEDYFAADLTSFSRPMRPTPTLLSSPPPKTDKVATARWMASTLTYGALSTVSARTEGTRVGDPFGNPYSFADVNGVPHIWATELDASMLDIFSSTVGNGRASLALSEASLAGTTESVAACTIGSFPLGDPENPPCARLVLSGNMVQLDVNTTEGAAAKAALFERHPAFASYPEDHQFLPVKMELDGIWLIDQFGGATIMAPEDYFAGSSAVLV